MIGEQKEEVEDIAFALEGMGLKDNDCTSIPKGSVEYFHGDEISPTGAEMLEKEFQIKKKPVDLDSGILAMVLFHIRHHASFSLTVVFHILLTLLRVRKNISDVKTRT